MVHLQAMTSNLPVTPMMVYGTGRWARINVKLHFFTICSNSLSSWLSRLSCYNMYVMNVRVLLSIFPSNYSWMIWTAKLAPWWRKWCLTRGKRKWGYQPVKNRKSKKCWRSESTFFLLILYAWNYIHPKSRLCCNWFRTIGNRHSHHLLCSFACVLA